MDREKQIKTLTDDINIYLDFDGTCECVKEDGECYPNYQVTIETPSLAKRLVNHGWSKTIWHKVADGDLPEIYQNVLVAVERSTKDGSDYIFTTIGKREPYTIDIAIWKILGQRLADEVIAWTELPTYEE